jgi:hypothetical protein
MEDVEDSSSLTMDPVPTWAPMNNTRMLFSAAVRTTSCDIMVTTNTCQIFDVKATGSEAIAKMPFSKVKTLQTPISLKAATLMQKLKVIENKNRRHTALSSEREAYLGKLAEEEAYKNYLMTQAVTKIQTIYRGHMCRPLPVRRTPYILRKKATKRTVQNEIHELLCEMAHQLRLKPIAGM